MAPQRSTALQVVLAALSLLAPLRAGPVFVEPRLLPGAVSPGGVFVGVVVADLDRDGALDVAATLQGPVWGSGSSEGREQVLVWLGNGDGSFQAPLRIDLGARDTIGVAGLVAADLDRDGVLDLVVAEWRARAVLVLRGLGDGTFEVLGITSTAPVQAGSVQAADLDGDGDPDLAVAPAVVDANATQVAVLRTGPGGHPGAPTLHGVAAFPANLVLADADGQRGPDVLVVGVTGALSVLANDGQGGFPATAVSFPVRVSGRGLWAGDYDGDGKLDVLVAGESGTYADLCGQGCLVTVHGNGDGTFAAPPPGNVRVTGAWPGRFYTAGNLAPDLDGDGRPDALFARSEGNLGIDEVTVYLSGAGTPSLTEWVASPGLPGDPGSRVDGHGSFAVAAGDLDRDGAPDLVVTTAAGTGAGTVAILRGVAGEPGTFAAPRVCSLSRGSGVQRGLALGRLDAGSTLDVAVITDALDVAQGVGDGTFGPAHAALARVAGPGEFYDTLRLADLDRDGDLDALFLATDGVQGGPAPRHLVALGAGDATFALVAALPAHAGHAGRNAVVADLDGNGTRDLAVLVSAVGGVIPSVSVAIELWKNDGLGTPSSFTAGPVLDLQAGLLFTSSTALAGADLDGDGDVDLVAHRFQEAGGDDLVLFRGRGDGTFLPAEPLTSDLGEEVTDLAVADLDGDGKLDLVVVHPSAVTVLLGKGDGSFAPRTAASSFPSGLGNAEARVADLDGDGKPDLLVGAQNGPAWHRGDGEGGFGPPWHLAVGMETAGMPLELGDLDGDGLADLVASHPTGEPGGGPAFDTLTVVRNVPGLAADLAVSAACAPEPVHVAAPLACTLTVTSQGPDPSAPVTLRAPLRHGVTFASAVPSQGTCAPAGAAVSCALGPIAPAASATVVLTVTPSRVGLHHLGAGARSAAADRRGQDDAALVTATALPASADLAITVTDTPDPVSAGADLTWTFTVRNDGPSAATGVLFTDPLPGGATFRSATSSAGGYQHDGNLVTAALGALAPGAQATVTVTATATTVGALENTATVSAAEEDPVPGNGKATARTEVVGPKKKGKNGCGCGGEAGPDLLAAALVLAGLWPRVRIRAGATRR